MFNLKAANGEVILTSERYTAKANAENGIDSVNERAVMSSMSGRCRCRVNRTSCSRRRTGR